MDLLVVGTLAFDVVETPHDTRHDILGGSASYCGACASYFAPVKLVGIVGEDFPVRHFDFFADRHIDTAGVTRAPGKTFRWHGAYEANMNVRHTRDTQLNVLADFRPDLPPNYRDSRFVVLGNFDPTLQRSVLDQLDKPRLVACDTMNFWIEGYRKELDKTLKRVQLLLLNESEARLLSGEHNLVKAARRVLTMGPEALVIKLGEHGAMLFDRHGFFNVPAFSLAEVVDPTGAGDSFAGGMMGYLARRGKVDGKSLREALVMGTVMASFSVTDFSVDAVRALKTTDIKRRLRDYLKLTQFGHVELDPFARD